MKNIIKVLSLLILISGMYMTCSVLAVTEQEAEYHDSNIVFGTEGEGALIEEQLESPESGWKRYDDTNELIEYLGLHKVLRDENYYSDTLSLSWGKESKIHFVVAGSKFRLLLGNVPEEFKVVDYPFELFKTKIYVDGNPVEAKCSISSRLNYARGCMLKYEYEFDSYGKHDVVLEMDSDIDEVHLDSIDVLGSLVHKSATKDSNGNIICDLHRYYNSDTGTYLYDFNDSQSLGQGYFKDGKTYKAYLNKTNSTVPVYEYYMSKENKYYYTLDKSLINENSKLYKFAGIKFYIDKSIADDMVITEKPAFSNLLSLYRYCNYYNEEHFYTNDINKLNEGNSIYRYEGVQCHLFEFEEYDTIKFHRYFRLADSTHFYTTDFSKYGFGNAEYKYEGICGYVYPSKKDGSTELYRYYNKYNKTYFFTTDYTELGEGNSVYTLEGVECYVIP